MLKKTLMVGAFALLAAGLSLPAAGGANAMPIAQTGSAPAGIAAANPNIEKVAYEDWRKKRKWSNKNSKRYSNRNYKRYGNNRDWRRYANKRDWRWDRRHHGPRYSYRYGRYKHYHNGYYYASPWWLLAPFAYAATAPGYYGGGYYGGGSAHVQWCLNRYRSYDPQTDTFMGYDGYRHRCNSPY